MIDAKPLRADARRNRSAVIAAARSLVATSGGEISLDEVARTAGVGIGTLYRHFPCRSDLLEAVFLDEVCSLVQLGRSLADADDPFAALVTYLRAHMEVGSHGHCMGSAVMAAKKTEGSPLHAASLELRGVSTALVERAKSAGAVRADVDPADLMRLVHGIVLANASAPDPEQQARMFDVVMAGVRA